ncbi:HEPN domain-containing protein [Peteryoungia algae]|uniref:HEPN domain-containing protein n=1 Tax=Peteryoungia algae TaxID=2919917 RepID=A0ABT0CX73_9HYPH|nr:HEPN domain-containing protein [Rhizobium sp. SSM4.3]MCJ8237777.1 HEPN domain-containing protein [Rhizobium sp. SSM4.3]
MSALFQVIQEEFETNLAALSAVVGTFSGPATVSAKARVAAANSVTLLLAATFEEFTREMARTYAKCVVASCRGIDEIPHKLLAQAWKRSMDGLSKLQFDTPTKRQNSVNAIHTRYTDVFDFTNGDLSKDIYTTLIHNENNMRPSQINQLFAVSNLSNLCHLICNDKPLLEHFETHDQGAAHGALLRDLDEFMDRRNDVAHAIAMSSSSGPDQLMKDIDLFRCIGQAMANTLISIAPQPYAAPEEVNLETSPTPQEVAEAPVGFTRRLINYISGGQRSPN